MIFSEKGKRRKKKEKEKEERGVNGFLSSFLSHFQFLIKLRTSISYKMLLPVMLRHNLIAFCKRKESRHMHIYMRIIISKVRIYVDISLRKETILSIWE